MTSSLFVSTIGMATPGFRRCPQDTSPLVSLHHRRVSIFLQHHFRGLDHDLNRISDLEAHLLGTPPRDHAFDMVIANAHHDVRHHPAELNLLDGAFKLVSSRKCHVKRLIDSEVKNWTIDAVNCIRVWPGCSCVSSHHATIPPVCSLP